jgi:CTP synthase
LKNANTTEANANTPHPVIHVMPEQKEYLAKKQYGGTIRLGAWPCVVKKNTLLSQMYHQFGDGKNAPWWISREGKSVKSSSEKMIIYERHRHRYEFNNEYKDQFEEKGFVVSGTSPDGKLVEGAS